MTNKECYKIWAPIGKKWVDWVRPVPFMIINNNTKNYKPLNISFPVLSNLDKNDKSMAIIVDLPGTQNIDVGIALAGLYGYRPIPIHNGVIEQKGSRATTDNSSVASALVWGASALSKLTIKDDANPVFLTDTKRLQRHKVDISVFDNSWDVYHQDLPTEDYFLKHGITKILIISNNLSKDLKKIFNQYPHKKIQILLTDGYESPKCIKKGKNK